MKYRVKNRKRIPAVLLAAMTVLILQTDVTVQARQNVLPSAKSCTFILPEDYQSSSEAGMFVNSHYPLDASNITFQETALHEETEGMTNAEKAASTTGATVQAGDNMQELSKESYEKMMAQQYAMVYGTAVSYQVSSFENITVDGFPGYRIEASWKDASQNIDQTVIMILSADKTYTITWSQAEDDLHTEDFAESQASVHVQSQS